MKASKFAVRTARVPSKGLLNVCITSHCIFFDVKLQYISHYAILNKKISLTCHAIIFVFPKFKLKLHIFQRSFTIWSFS